MTIHYNKNSQTELRRFLRKHLSKAEAVLLQDLSRKQMIGYKFRRQYGVDRYVIDFYCPELKLAIEVDGDTHFQDEAVEYDRLRQEYIEAFGIQFMRVTNNDVLHNLNGVLRSIEDKIHEIEGSK